MDITLTSSHASQSTNTTTPANTSDKPIGKIHNTNHLVPHINVFDSEYTTHRLPASSFSNSASQGNYQQITVGEQTLKIHYFEAGDSNKPVLFCVHGFQSNAYQFSKVFDELARDYHVIAIDLPGCGYSDLTENNDYDFSTTLPKILDAFTKQKQLAHITVVCSSMGYAICAPWATMKENPIDQIIIFNGLTPLGHPNFTSNIAQKVGKMKASSDLFEKLAVRYTLSNIHRKHTFGSADVQEFFNPYSSKDPKAPARKIARAIYATLVAKLIADPAEINAYEEYNNNIKVPVLIVQSEWDELVPSKDSAFWLSDTIPQSKLLIIPKREVPTAGHTLMSDTPEVAVKIINDFMKNQFPTYNSETINPKMRYWNYRSGPASHYELVKRPNEKNG